MDEQNEQRIKKKIKNFILKIGVPIMFYIFLGLIVAGMIFGPAIKIGAGGSGDSTSGSYEEEKDFDNFLNYFYAVQTKTDVQNKRIDYGDGPEDVPHYKIKTNGNGHRIVGHNLNLSQNTEIDNDLKLPDSYGAGGTNTGKLISVDEVEAYEEGLILDIIDAIQQRASSTGVSLTTYQMYALVSVYYDNGGINAAKSDSLGLIAQSTIYTEEIRNKYYGNKDKAIEENEDDEDDNLTSFYEYFIECKNPDNEAKIEKDYKLFHAGYYSDIDMYCAQ